MLGKVILFTLTAAVLLALHTSRHIIRSISPSLFNTLKMHYYEDHDSDGDPLTLHHLQQLSQIPLLGQLFLESKVRLLVQERRWKEVIEECSLASASLIWVGEVKMLPFRAVAECATYQFAKCEETIREITVRAPHLLSSITSLQPSESGQDDSKREQSATLS
jgi:hypothetical protein